MNAASVPDEIGRYLVERPLGHGAMGQVVLARDPVLDRTVAIKLLRGDLKIPADQKASLIKRMRQEARASARVSHPHIVALHDMGEDERLGLYLVFEYAEGTTLKERLEAGTLANPAVARLAREMGDALTTAHLAGVLHRDVKPENIILSRTGAKIADFGIARVPNSTLTRDGGLLGTPAYSSPESIDTGEFSPASDQFSMAATLYEAISGARAFPGNDAVAVATRISTESPRPIARQRGCAPQVDAVLLRAMAKNPKDRFKSCAEFGEALGGALEANKRPAMPTMPDRRRLQNLDGGSETRVRRAAVGGAAVGALLAIAAFQLTSSMRPNAARPERAAEEHALPEPAVGWLAAAPSATISGAKDVRPTPSTRKPNDQPKAAARAVPPEPKAEQGSGPTAPTPVSEQPRPTPADAGLPPRTLPPGDAGAAD